MLAGFAESLAMTATSTAVGVILALPLAVGASGNLAPRWVYLPCRAFIAFARSLNEIIVAILLVVLFGFGPFTGFLTLTFATVAFMAKLLAERIELLDPVPLEALAATGAGLLQRLDYAVFAPVMPRLLGLSLYRLDINFRESAVIGVVGAGGIGATLHTAMDRYEYATAGAIVLLIVAIVLAAEFLSGVLRRRLL
jgi:phosphonate transport system permease protein